VTETFTEKEITNMDPDPNTRGNPLSIIEVERKRLFFMHLLEDDGKPIPSCFTCDSCERKLVCRMVFDEYNVAGQCMYKKKLERVGSV
jgi:hypothetical protein